ncbi:hypothetical protein GGG16DRAFT_103070 [Schizophyllum commune]
MQPADVGLQRPVKHVLKQAMFDYLTAKHQAQIAAGVEPKDFKMITSFPTLRNACAWRKSGPPGKPHLSLSPEWLTSNEAHTALDEYLQNDPTLYEEICNRVGHVYGSFNAAEHKLDPAAPNDSDIPLSNVIHDMFGEDVDVSDVEFWYGTPLTVTECQKGTTEGLGLETAGVKEDILMFGDNGECYSAQNLPYMLSMQGSAPSSLPGGKELGMRQAQRMALYSLDHARASLHAHYTLPERSRARLSPMGDHSALAPTRSTGEIPTRGPRAPAVAAGPPGPSYRAEGS